MYPRCAFLSFLCLFLSHYVAPEENPVYEYGPDNFKQQIEEMDGNFIMFYAPWFVLFSYHFIQLIHFFY